MKTSIKLIILALTVFLFNACDQDYIDGISKVDQGADESAPVVKILSPTEGYQIKVPDVVAPVTISFEATDDIELASVSVKIDGTEIVSYSDFRDYRRAIGEYVYDNVTNGVHELTIIATDLEGESTTAKVNFEKVSPYSPKYDGEMFYMPFDNDYMEMISFQYATKVGSPAFAGESVAGANAYKGTEDAYLTFSAENLKSTEFSATFWYYVDPDPARAGILSSGASADSRNQGFRLFREGDATSQRIKLNVGTGSGESWNDGDLVDATAGKWVHIAVTISGTENIIYFDGAPVHTAVMSAPIDWTGCDEIAIGSGGPTYSYWDHLSDYSFIDELRFYNKALSASEIQTIIYNDMPYEPQYDGEVFYMPFEENNKDLVTNMEAGVVGTPGFDEGIKGKAYAGAADSYITFPTATLQGTEFSAAFWIKLDASTDRAGILSTGSEAENRQYGFRLFREGDAASQRIKLNVGTGNGESWNDGGLLDPTTGEWVHIAITISETTNTIYFNGEEIASVEMTAPIDWTGCEYLTIGAGGETFSYWDHLSDLSPIDELRMFSKALSKEEVDALMQSDI
jgi:hypothetical protein